MKDSDFSYKLLIRFVWFHVQQPYFVELPRYHSFKIVQSLLQIKSAQNFPPLCFPIVVLL